MVEPWKLALCFDWLSVYGGACVSCEHNYRLCTSLSSMWLWWLVWTREDLCFTVTLCFCFLSSWRRLSMRSVKSLIGMRSKWFFTCGVIVFVWFGSLDSRVKVVSEIGFTVLVILNKLLTVVINLFVWDKHTTFVGTLRLLICMFGGVMHEHAAVYHQETKWWCTKKLNSNSIIEMKETLKSKEKNYDGRYPSSEDGEQVHLYWTGPLLVDCWTFDTSSLSSELEGDLLSCLSFFGIDYVILFLS